MRLSFGVVQFQFEFHLTKSGNCNVTIFFITLILFHNLTLEIGCCGNMIGGGN